MNREALHQEAPSRLGIGADAPARPSIATRHLPEVQPSLPPGRSCRKARAYGPQIRRLHTEGYSFEQIRAALVEVGLVVSKSTVRREASRASVVRHAATAPRAVRASEPSSVAPRPAATNEDSAFGDSLLPARPQSGREVAAAFYSQHITNPLVRKDPR